MILIACRGLAVRGRRAAWFLAGLFNGFFSCSKIVHSLRQHLQEVDPVGPLISLPLFRQYRWWYRPLRPNFEKDVVLQ